MDKKQKTAKYKIQNTKYKIQNTKYKIQITKYKIQNTKYKIQIEIVQSYPALPALRVPEAEDYGDAR